MLNPKLYRALQRAFGTVKVWSEDVPLIANYVVEASTGRKKLNIVQRGETFAVNCPFCHKYSGRADRKYRLNINHRWGTKLSRISNEEWRLAICFNENCLVRDKLNLEILKSTLDRRLISSNFVTPIEQQNVEELEEVPLPENTCPVNSLPYTHPAIQYLLSRKFDVNFLTEKYNVLYCYAPDYRYKLAYDRIIIPIYFEGKLVGWQGRYIGNPPSGIPKYYTAPKTPLGRILYNYDSLLPEVDFVLVVEGVIDSWRFGGVSVASFGKHLSSHQVKLLRDLKKKVYLFWDSDAVEEAEQTKRRLSRYLAIEVLPCSTGDPAELIL